MLAREVVTDVLDRVGGRDPVEELLARSTVISLGMPPGTSSTNNA